MAPRIAFEVAGEVVVHHDDLTGTIVATWARFGSQCTFQDCLNAQADLIEEGRAWFIIVDISQATGSPSARDHDYVHRFVYPRFRRGGLAAIVTVLPQDGRTRMATRGWNRNGQAWRFDATDADTLAAAHGYIAAFTQRPDVDARPDPATPGP